MFCLAVLGNIGKLTLTFFSTLLHLFSPCTALLQQLPDFTDVDLCRGDYISELTRMQELTEENTKLRSQLLELQQPSEVDSSSLIDSGQQSRSMVSWLAETAKVVCGWYVMFLVLKFVVFPLLCHFPSFLSPSCWQSPELESLREENRRLIVQLDEMMKVLFLLFCVCFFVIWLTFLGKRQVTLHSSYL